MANTPAVLHSMKVKDSQQALHVLNYDWHCIYSKSKPPVTGLLGVECGDFTGGWGGI